MSAQEPNCPKCGNAYGVAGVVVRKITKDILFWECMECGTRMHRFEEGTVYRQRAERWLAKTYGKART